MKQVIQCLKVGDSVECPITGNVGHVVTIRPNDKYPVKVSFGGQIFSYSLFGRGAGLEGSLDYRSEVLRNCPNFKTDSIEKKLSLGGLGVSGEAGEVADLIKKILHHEVPLESVREKLIKEMGDVYWYLEYLEATLEIEKDEVLLANALKLRKRHPSGWTPQSQQAKADEAST